MSANNGSAEILDIENARARRRGANLSGADYKHIGVFLAASREAQGYSLTEAAAKTHIRENHLAAIEGMNRSALPARPYAIGFVKTYAEFLELEAKPIVMRFKEEAGYEAAAPIAVEKFEAAEAAAESQPREMTLWAVAGVLAFILWCAWQITLPHEVTRLGEHSSPLAISQSTTNAALPDPALQPADAEIIEARIIERIEPVYPRSCAAAARAVETATISFNVTAKGRISGERIAQTTNACFDDAALNAIRRWRFEPRMVDGAPRTAFDQKIQFSFQRPG